MLQMRQHWNRDLPEITQILSAGAHIHTQAHSLPRMKSVVPQGQKNKVKEKCLGMQKWKKTRPLSPFPPCFNSCGIFEPSWVVRPVSPSASYKKDVSTLLFSHRVHPPHPVSKWLTRFLPCSLSPSYKNGPRTHVQGRLYLEPTHCSNSISHSNKL